MSLEKLREAIEYISCLTGDCGQLVASTARDASAEAPIDSVVTEDVVADLDGVVKRRTSNRAEVPIRTGILRRG